MATEGYDEFPGKTPDPAELARLRIERMVRLGATECKRTQGPIRCTRCGGWWDLWYDPEVPGYTILRHCRPTHSRGFGAADGHELYYQKIDAWAWIQMGQDIAKFMAAIQGAAHPLERNAPAHRRGKTVRRG